jgi:uncharacterized protein YciI
MFHVVVRRSGPEWDPARPLEEQSGWPAHAAFMDGLVEDGVIVLGGPLADELRVVHAVQAESEDEVRETLARDPWSETHLVVEAVEPWTIRLDARGASPDSSGNPFRPEWLVARAFRKRVATRAATRAIYGKTQVPPLQYLDAQRVPHDPQFSGSACRFAQ